MYLQCVSRAVADGIGRVVWKIVIELEVDEVEDRELRVRSSAVALVNFVEV